MEDLERFFKKGLVRIWGDFGVVIFWDLIFGIWGFFLRFGIFLDLGFFLRFGVF